ncbi:MAG: hypothetical protein IKT62_02080 [Firmicutes bacterium]|nr:hypothetical protein [Bacillota bacterium]
MKLGMSKADMPEVKTAGKAALKIVGVGLAAGVALIAATNKVMTKLTSKKDEAVKTDETLEDEE